MEQDWKVEFDWHQKASLADIKRELKKRRNALFEIGMTEQNISDFDEIMGSYMRRVIKQELAMYTGSHEYETVII